MQTHILYIDNFIDTLIISNIATKMQPFPYFVQSISIIVRKFRVFQAANVKLFIQLILWFQTHSLNSKHCNYAVLFDQNALKFGKCTES